MDDHTDSYREREVCPLYTAIGVVSGRWKPMILQRLGSGPLGFGELQRAMPRVTAKVLREQLRQLQADDLVTRRALKPVHRGVRYQLTPYAETLNPVFNALLQWGVKHLGRSEAASGTRISPPLRRHQSPSSARNGPQPTL
jgi:DNA-binding HxlR family transcriptional regulator